MSQFRTGILFDIAWIDHEVVLYVLEGASGREGGVEPGSGSESRAGEMKRYKAPYAHTVYLAAGQKGLEKLTQLATSSPAVAVVGATQRREFYSNRMIPVIACRVLSHAALKGFVKQAMRTVLGAEVYDSRIEPQMAFLYRHRLHPLAQVAFRTEGERILDIRATDDPWNPLFLIPPLKVLQMELESPQQLPIQQNTLRLTGGLPEGGGGLEGFQVQIPLNNPVLALPQLAEALQQTDPDVILSRGGDGIIFPFLFEQANQLNIPLPLDRDEQAIRRRIQRQGKSFLVYGTMFYKAPSYPLFGRWHLDADNSFFIRESGMEGLVELSRISRLPLQRMARSSAGTAMTSMEIDVAYGQGYLIPTHKTQVERVKSALELLRVDKGGLTYFPPPGIYENVLEADYAQMYPTIMQVHNISPEVMNCACCPDVQPVPGTHYRTCTHRRGLVPTTLEPVLVKRSQYKQLKGEASGELRRMYEGRYSALKWLLVTTFGYQGFRNALFGLIEAHEAITAWGRESLLRAKETFEEAGFEMLHALTDSIYVQHPGHQDPEAMLAQALRLGEQVSQETGITLAVEGVYDWICFTQSKMRDQLSAATRYFGRLSNGAIKVRGLMIRRRDTPEMIKQAQREMLAVMGRQRSLADLTAAHDEIVQVAMEVRQRLLGGKVNREHLLLKSRVTQSLQDYRANSPARVCMERLQQAGVQLMAGESVRYLVQNRKATNPLHRYLPEMLVTPDAPYEALAYLELLQAAYNELIHALPVTPINLVQGVRQHTLWEAG